MVIKDKKNDNLKFSNVALNELKQMCDNVEEMYSIAIDILSNGKFEELDRLSKLEEMTDEYKEKFSAKHFERLSQENCSMELGAYYITIISQIERVGDHIVNIGFSTKNPTGVQNLYVKHY